MSKKDNPSYYAIIPANIRYCKSLIPSAKILYGEITCLCNKNGYCWATNNYFAKLYGKDKMTISTWIHSLEENGFIKCVVKNNNQRRIYIQGPIGKPIGAYRKTYRVPIGKPIGSYNNTRRNKKTYIRESEKTDSLITKKQTPSFDDIHARKLEKALRSKRKLYNAKPKNWPFCFSEFRRKNNITKKRMREVLLWYIKHFDDKYTPKAYSAKRFCEKFPNIEDAMSRNIEDVKNGKPRKVVGKHTRRPPVYGNGPVNYEEVFE